MSLSGERGSPTINLFVQLSHRRRARGGAVMKLT